MKNLLTSFKAKLNDQLEQVQERDGLRTTIGTSQSNSLLDHCLCCLNLNIVDFISESFVNMTLIKLFPTFGNLDNAVYYL